MAGLLLDPNRPALLQGAGQKMTAKQIAEEVAKEKAKDAAAKAASKAALTSTKAAAPAARGLLSRGVGAALGPVGLGFQAALAPGNLDGGELSPEQRDSMMPQDQADSANQYAQGVAQRAAQAGIDYKNDMTPEPTPQVAQEAPQESPQVDPMVAAEPLRQQAKVGLDVAQSRGNLPVKQIATALVDKQIESEGTKISPGDREKRISQERKLISDLPKEEKTDYLSWALVAAGLVAGALDESGGAGRAFGTALDSQLERKNKLKLQEAEKEARAAELETEREFRREQMDNSNAQMDKRFTQQDKQLASQQAQQMLLFEKGQELQRAQMSQQERYQNSMLGLQQQRIEAAIAKESGAAAPKLDIKQEDAESITKGISSQLGVPFSKEVNQSVAAQLRAAAKTDPNFDPQRFVQMWIKANQNKLETKDPFFGAPRTNFKPIVE